MTTIELPLFDSLGVGQQTQEIRQSLRRLERRDWSLWGSAIAIMLSLIAAVASLSVSVSAVAGEPFFAFQMSQSVRGLLGLVLHFSVYTIYQQVQFKNVRGRLTDQIEISAQEHARAQEFLKLAMLDPLTGLHNRRFAQERLSAEIARSERKRQPLTVLMLDLDNFKQLNDRYGHPVGDLVLRGFAERLTIAIRGSDWLCESVGMNMSYCSPNASPGRYRWCCSGYASRKSTSMETRSPCVSQRAGQTIKPANRQSSCCSALTKRYTPKNVLTRALSFSARA